MLSLWECALPPGSAILVDDPVLHGAPACGVGAVDGLHEVEVRPGGTAAVGLGREGDIHRSVRPEPDRKPGELEARKGTALLVEVEFDLGHEVRRAIGATAGEHDGHSRRTRGRTDREYVVRHEPSFEERNVSMQLIRGRCKRGE